MSLNFVMFQDEKNREMIMIPFPKKFRSEGWAGSLWSVLLLPGLALCLLRHAERRGKHPVPFLADDEAEDEVEFHGASSLWKMMVSKGWAG